MDGSGSEVPHPDLLDTSDLLARIRAGDREACGDLFERYRSRLDVFLRARLPIAARGLMETQDLVQEVCIRALPGLERFEYRGLGSFWAYLRRISLNHVRDVWQTTTSKTRTDRLSGESWAAPEAPDATPLSGLLSREQVESFEAVIGRLAEKRRHALLMRIELGLPYRAIADECAYPTANAARMDISRTIEKVGKEMAGYAS